jgi:uncharacterized iron-regulated protein
MKTDKPRIWFISVNTHAPDCLSDTAARSLEKLKLGRYPTDEVVRVIEYTAVEQLEQKVKELEDANSELVTQANKILDEKTSLTFKLMEETAKAESMQRFHDNLVKQLQRGHKAYCDLQDEKLAAQEREIERLVDALSFDNVKAACEYVGIDHPNSIKDMYRELSNCLKEKPKESK